MSERRRALLSLHDVTPFHLARLEAAEALFRELGVRRVAYLLIPDYHGAHPADTPAFRAWCRRERPFEVEWLLHGYSHLDDAGLPAGSATASFRRRFSTAGEGEFLTLDAPAMDERLARGTDVFERATGAAPAGFVPPAWLYGEALPDVLRRRGFTFWEDRRFVYDVPGERRHPTPVITWATRTPLRKWTSILGAPVLARRWESAPLLRLAVHPFDFDHPATVGSIRRVWTTALAVRWQTSYGQVVGASDDDSAS